MTKIKPVRVGIDWRAEVEFALRFIALGFVLGLRWIVLKG